jgi:hypothetical protein
VAFGNPVADGSDGADAGVSGALASADRYRIIELAKPARHKALVVCRPDGDTLEEAAAAVEASGILAGLLRHDAALHDVIAGLYEVSAQMSDAASAGAGAFGLLAMTNPVEGREAEFDAWYVGEHMRDVMGVKGFAEAERLRLQRALAGTPRHRFLGVYRMEANDQARAGATLQEAGKSGMTLSDTLAPDSASFLLQAAG